MFFFIPPLLQHHLSQNVQISFSIARLVCLVAKMPFSYMSEDWDEWISTGKAIALPVFSF